MYILKILNIHSRPDYGIPNLTEKATSPITFQFDLLSRLCFHVIAAALGLKRLVLTVLFGDSDSNTVVLGLWLMNSLRLTGYKNKMILTVATRNT